jgi:hypothetical protein
MNLNYLKKQTYLKNQMNQMYLKYLIDRLHHLYLRYQLNLKLLKYLHCLKRQMNLK